jgi:hypothetical protein
MKINRSIFIPDYEINIERKNEGEIRLDIFLNKLNKQSNKIIIIYRNKIITIV